MKKRLQLLLLIFISAVSWFISNQLATKNTVLSVLIGLVAVWDNVLIVSLLYYLIVKLIAVIFHIIENNRTSLDRYKKS
ncbi:MAG: hypothetical protein ACLTA0_06570 [Streptococcus agalactiae]